MTRAKQLPIAIGFVLVGVLGLVGLVRSSPSPETRERERPLTHVRALTVAKETVQITVSSQGTVAPRAETTLVPEVAGKVHTIAPELAEGAFFRAGDVLLEIDPRDYELALVQAEANVAGRAAQLALEEGEAALARAEWESMGAGRAADPLVLREPQLRNAQAALAAAEASRDQAQLALRRTRIVAPYAGRVRAKLVDVGQYVGPGTPVAQIYAVDAAEIRLPILAADLAYLPLGDLRKAEAEGPMVQLSADWAGQRRNWQGRIVRTSAQIDPRSQMVHLIARVEDPYGSIHEAPLEIGLFVAAEIVGHQQQNIVRLPREALRAEDRVFVIKEGRLRFRDVTVLKLESERVLISAGLDEGELVCPSTLEAAVEGMRVAIAGDAS